MKKDWTKKCTCENFQQNEDCEHIGNKVLVEVGLGIGDKDCPDCLPYDGCAKHFIKNGDRHDRLEGALTGALTPLGEKLAIKNKLKKQLFYATQIDYDEYAAINNYPTPDEIAEEAINNFVAEIKKKIIEKSTFESFESGVSSNGWYQIYKDDLDSIL